MRPNRAIHTSPPYLRDISFSPLFVRGNYGVVGRPDLRLLCLRPPKNLFSRVT